MMIATTLLNVDFLTSSKSQNLIRKKGAFVLQVYIWLQVITHEQDGSQLAYNDLDLLCFYTGLDIEQIKLALAYLGDLNIIQKDEIGYFSQSVIDTLGKIAKKREVYSENAKTRWSKKSKKNVTNLDTQSPELSNESNDLMQLHCNGNANLQNTKHKTQNIKDQNIKQETDNTKPKSKKTLYSIKESITDQEYQELLHDPELVGGDREFLKQCCLEMQDWSKSNNNKKVDWLATLRNWIRRNSKHRTSKILTPINFKTEADRLARSKLMEFAKEQDRLDALKLKNTLEYKK